MIASDELSGHVLIVTGPPGAGKTTAADAIAAMASCSAVHLRADEFWQFIKSGHIEAFRPEAHAQNAVVMDALTRAAAAFACGRYLVVLDGVIGPWFLKPFRSLNAPVHYIVLRPTLQIALDRVRERGAAQPLASEPVRSLHRKFSALGELERHVIDTTSYSPAETQAAVMAAARSGRFRLT
jgi:broad-specificity NMP kinase